MADRHTKTIMMRLMADKMTFDQAQKALDNPEAYKTEEKRKSLLRNRIDGKTWPGRYHWWGKIKTARKTVAYCWGVKRNRAGYFLGWREVYGPKGEMIERDQFVARKSKKRLSLLQKRRTDALRNKTTASTRQ